MKKNFLYANKVRKKTVKNSLLKRPAQKGCALLFGPLRDGARLLPALSDCCGDALVCPTRASCRVDSVSDSYTSLPPHFLEPQWHSAVACGLASLCISKSSVSSSPASISSIG